MPGHMNAVFVKDANALLPRAGLNPVDAAREELKAAVFQGAFTVWIHPYLSVQQPAGVAVLDPVHAEFIQQGLLRGSEVAAGADMSDEAFRIALDHDLAIPGTSAVHGLIDWESDLAGGGHRTATLVLTTSPTADGVKAALRAGEAVAVYNDNRLGRPANVEGVVRSSIGLEVGVPLPRTRVVSVSMTNDGPVDDRLQNTGPEGAYDEGHVFIVRSGVTQGLPIKDVDDPAKLSLTFKVLNAYTVPCGHLTLQLRDRTP